MQQTICLKFVYNAQKYKIYKKDIEKQIKIWYNIKCISTTYGYEHWGSNEIHRRQELTA